MSLSLSLSFSSPAGDDDDDDDGGAGNDEYIPACRFGRASNFQRWLVDMTARLGLGPALEYSGQPFHLALVMTLQWGWETQIDYLSWKSEFLKVFWGVFPKNHSHSCKMKIFHGDFSKCWPDQNQNQEVNPSRCRSFCQIYPKKMPCLTKTHKQFCWN